MGRARNGVGRARAVTVVALGLTLGISMMVAPASGHVTGSLSHLVGHMKSVFYTKSQTNARFVPRARLKSSGRVTLFNAVNQTVVKKTLIQDGPFRLEGWCPRNNVGSLQSEVIAFSKREDSYIDSFGNGTDGALARSKQFGGEGVTPQTIAVLTVVPAGRFDARTFTAVAPNGRTLTGTVSSGTSIQGADCVFTATVQR